LDRVYAALERIPLFKGARREAIELEPLGSLTNSTFKVTMGGVSYALRLPGKDTADYIDRIAEEHNARIATAAGINAGIFYFDSGDGTMLSRFIEGTAMDEERFERDPLFPIRAGRTLRRVHDLGPVFETRFDVFTMLDNYLEILRKMRMPLPEGYFEVERGVEAVWQALEASPMPLVACHNDPWPGNFVDTGERLYLIDWEFSGMNDPMWDLGDLSVEAGFGPEQDRTMMEAYFGGAASPALYSRLALYKVMSDLLWAFWGFIQVANDNPRDDFLAYARGRFERCKARLDDADFGKHLNAARAGHRRSATKYIHPANPERKIQVLRKDQRSGRRPASHPPS